MRCSPQILVASVGGGVLFLGPPVRRARGLRCHDARSYRGMPGRSRNELPRRSEGSGQSIGSYLSKVTGLARRSFEAANNSWCETAGSWFEPACARWHVLCSSWTREVAARCGGADRLDDWPMVLGGGRAAKWRAAVRDGGGAPSNGAPPLVFSIR